jgi:hypothetical protein
VAKLPSRPKLRVPATCPAANATRLRRSTNPFAVGESFADLVGVGALRGGHVGFARPGRVGGCHVGVIGGPGVQAGQEFVDEGLLVAGQGGIGQLFPGDGGRGGVALGGGAEAAEAVRGVHLGGVGQGGELVDGGVLVAEQVVGVGRAEQVRAADRAVEQRPSGEHRDRLAVVGQRVGQVGESVPGRGHHPHGHRGTDRDEVTVGHGHPVEGDGVVGVDVVRGTGALREGVSAGDVVVVEVGLEDVGDPNPVGGGQVEDAVDVTLRVDHECDLAVVHEIAAIAERRGVDGQDVRHGRGSLAARWVQAVA